MKMTVETSAGFAPPKDLPIVKGADQEKTAGISDQEGDDQ